MNERDALLAWFDANARDLPWRRTRDPYAIWVSEVMLQQTRVETVLRYYERFLARFPDAHALASASEDDVLSMWSGLGYYRRARLLHAGVREVVASYGGRVPDDATSRRALPGVGRYTAGAIGSIAFDREEPLVDGNVARVLSRLRGIDTPLGRRDTEARLWDEAEKVVRGPRPGALNQALMELGATVCTPSSPKCLSCPITRSCVALASDRTDVLPVAKARRAPREVAMVAVVAHDAQGRAMMVRGEKALFGGLWGVPMREGRGAKTAREALREHAIDARLTREPAGHIEHVLTHRRLDVEVFVARLSSASAGTASASAGTGARAVGADDLASVGVSTLTRRILEMSDLTISRFQR
ncbi:A/G-specific adenine glycosylase [Sandaracinus amylolyticus]|nr:A/G-specific adenine glycosylase [Sandaracinus amylolyticus]